MYSPQFVWLCSEKDTWLYFHIWRCKITLSHLWHICGTYHAYCVNTNGRSSHYTHQHSKRVSNTTLFCPLIWHDLSLANNWMTCISKCVKCFNVIWNCTLSGLRRVNVTTYNMGHIIRLCSRHNHDNEIVRFLGGWWPGRMSYWHLW